MSLRRFSDFSSTWLLSRTASQVVY